MTTAREIFARPSVALGLACLVLHALGNGQYGFFRDELYFIVAGSRPDWGYVDQPALVPLLAAAAHGLFGDFLWGFRILPALAMAAMVALTAEFTRLIGGGRFAQALAGLCALLAPVFLIQGMLFSTDMFQALTWLGLAWVLVRLEQTGDQRWWLAFGAIAGFSLNTKYLIAFYLAALAIGLLATPLRKSLLRPWVWLGAGVALLMLLPNLAWQHAHGWPFLELGKAGASGKNTAMSLPAFALEQVILIGPWAAIVWLCGLWACAAQPKFAVGRALAIAWALLLLVFTLSHGKAYYLSAIYPALLAFGAARVEGWMRLAAARTGALASVTVLGLLALPFALPVLPVERFIRYQNAVGFMPSSGENLRMSALPQYYADMFGWREMAEKVAKVYWSLPPKERARAVFFGDNYGEAAAIDVFGRRLGLPPSVSGHNNYYVWGPRGHDGSVLIILGGDRNHYAELFQSTEVAGRLDAPYAMPYEAKKPIYVLRNMKPALQDYWPEVKNFQ